MSKSLGEWFVRGYRGDDGEGAFWTLADGRPGWLVDAVREAHDDELPNDWRYAKCRAIAESIDDAGDEFDAFEWADGATCVYTFDLLQWVAECSRWTLADDVLEEIGGEVRSVGNLLVMAQCRALELMASVMFQAWQENRELECDGCGRVGTDEDGCYLGDECPAEDCTGSMRATVAR